MAAAAQRSRHQGPLSGIAGGTGLAILGLWAGPWLSDIGKFNKNEIANILFISTIMMTIGTTSLGIITDYLRKFNNWLWTCRNFE